MKKILGFLCLTAMAMMSGQAQDTDRTLLFSDYMWRIKDSSNRTSAPGPNYFSSSRDIINVDDQGKLHLRILRRDERWQCAEIISRKKFGLGTYTLTIDSLSDSFPPTAVLGLFTYDPQTPPDYSEIDTEISRWGDSRKENQLNFTVQPYNSDGNSINFPIDRDAFPLKITMSWKKDHISFSADSESEDNDTHMYWSYDGSYIPEARKPAFRINLWLFQGKPAETECEVILSRFSFEPDHHSLTPP